MDSKYGTESKELFPEDRNMEFLKFAETDDIKKKVYIPTADDNGNTSWGELTAVTRHDPGEKLYEFTTESGRKVVVADSESMLIWNDEEKIFQKKQSRDIKLNECAPVIASLPAPPIINTSVDNFELNYDNGLLLARYINEDKVVPDFAYTAPDEFIMGLLNGYFSSNEVSSVSQKLIHGISTLCARVGIFGKISTIEGDNTEYVISLDKDWKNKVKETTQYNNVVMDKIIKIQEISNHNEIKLYDVTVPSTLNFSGADGLLYRDTSETGYLNFWGFKSNRNVLIWDKNIIKPFNGPIIIHSC